MLLISLVAYFQYSAYYIFGTTNRSVRIGSGWLFVAFYAFMTVFVWVNLVLNFRTLMNHRRTMQDPSMSEIRRGLCTKIIMFVLFGLVIAVYYIIVATCLVLHIATKLTNRESIVLANIERVVVLVTVILLTTIFHPCFYTASFQLGQIHQVRVEVDVGGRRRRANIRSALRCDYKSRGDYEAEGRFNDCG
eukprot:TRINITY_DN4909_c0_g2_i10.p1 TRINITY_DN4909_c0_g2~~TRINITY_DN4909_c0_g2_i10.p1  ORF type:complete len:191 (+),score=15.06 TRINITY_DN4909_c0_g2_i10:1005-1577(+)